MRLSLGRSGLTVDSLGFGAAALSIQGRPARSDALALLRFALESGVDLIDSADSYALDECDHGHNEALIREAIASQGASGPIVVATKGGLRRPGGAWLVDGRPAWLRSACESSVRSLGVEALPLYQLHAPDPSVPYGESIEALAKLQQEGKIVHIGVCNVTPEELETALSLVRVETVQNRLHPLCKGDLRNGLVDICRERGITYIAYSPVGGDAGRVRLAETALFQELAAALGWTVHEIALAWVASRAPAVVAIPGASRRKSLESTLATRGRTLDAGTLARIDALPDVEGWRPVGRFKPYPR